MEGNGGFGYMNLQNYPLQYPSLTPIDMLLWGQKENILGTHENRVLDPSCNSYSNYGDHQGYVNSGFNGGWNLYGSGNDFDDHHDYMNPNLGLSNVNSESNDQESFKQVEMKFKAGYYSSNYPIKGQWTDEEDRELVKLVKQYGVRKWAQIAEKMAGRAGKQCRERWNNHLRPDIKKDSWSEEEERMLIEAHMKIGNKWAEIAKQIPGRTENSIKNHWNATKRRQNTRKKTKKNHQYDQPNLLQDYIKANISKPKTSENTPTPATSTISDDDLILNTQINDLPLQEEEYYYSSQPLITNTYDDELKFLMNVFGNKPNEVSQTTEPKNVEFGNKVNEELPNKNYMYSDMYISYLLDGGSNGYGASDQDFMSNGDHKMEVEMNNEEGRSDMDLVEMVSSSSQFY